MDYGNNFDTPVYIVYDSLVSKDSVQTMLILEALNGIYAWCTGAQNDYLNVKLE